jgi:hypothetical protein
MMVHPAGPDFIVAATTDGYAIQAENVTVFGGDVIWADFDLPAGHGAFEGAPESATDVDTYDGAKNSGYGGCFIEAAAY